MDNPSEEPTSPKEPGPVDDANPLFATEEGEQNKKSKVVRTWQEMYACLLKYKEENNGSVSVPRQYKPDKNLGEWVVKQRMYQRKLTPDQRKQLENAGFSFEGRLEGYERKWQEMYEELKRFKEEKGHCVVPESTRTDMEGLGKLARWIHYQRKHNNRGQLAKERINKLNELGFVWQKHKAKAGMGRKEPSTARVDGKWNGFYAKLEEFYKENGHSKILQDCHDQQLYFWFKSQRTLFHQGLLREDRKLQLDKLDMVWDTKETLMKNWELQFERLLNYKAENGTVNCAHRYEQHGLGNWIAYQKRTFREGTVEPERAKRLLEVEMAYVAEKDYSWNDRFAKLKPVESWDALTKDPELERWTRLQLLLLDCNKQSRDRRLKLESIRLDRLAAMPSGPMWKPRPKYKEYIAPVIAVRQAARASTTRTTEGIPIEPKPNSAVPASDQPCEKLDDYTQAEITYGEPATVTMASRNSAPVLGSTATTSRPSFWEGTGPKAIMADNMTPEPMIGEAEEADVLAAPSKTTTDQQALPAATECISKQTPQSVGEPALTPTFEQPPPAAENPGPPASGAEAALVATTTILVPEGEAVPEGAKPVKRRGRPRLHPMKVSTRKKKRTWFESFQALVDFKEMHGTIKLPSAYPQDNALLKWAKKQRTYKHTLTDEQISLLEGVGFIFDGHIELREKKWEHRFNKMVEFIRQQGHPLVTRAHDKDLNLWVSDQRKKYKIGTLRHDRLDRLNSIGFVWVAIPETQKKTIPDQFHTPKQNETWQLQYDKLSNFHRTHGHCDVPSDQDSVLVVWMRKQRTLHHKQVLPEERIAKLDKLGFIWKHKQHNEELVWNAKYDMLVLHKERHGHCNLSKNGDRWGLGSWCGTQRGVFKAGDMFPERARQLLSLGFPVILENEASWIGRYNKLKALTTFDETWRDPPFQRWIELQRVLIETDSLPSDKKQMLLNIDLLWENSENGHRNSRYDEGAEKRMADSNDIVGEAQPMEELANYHTEIEFPPWKRRKDAVDDQPSL